MESVGEAIIEILQKVIHGIIPADYFPLIAAAVFLTMVIGVSTYAITTARIKAVQNVSNLVNNLSVVTEKLRQAEAMGHFGSFIWDFENPSVSFWSREMYELFGMVERERPPEIDELFDIAHEKDRNEVKNGWDKARSRSGEFNINFRIVHRDGSIRYLNIRGKTLIGPSQKLKQIQGVAHDVTKEAEIDRAKSEFVSLASHQLKTPLTSIKWLTEALLSGSIGNITNEQRKYIANILESEHHMMEMINELLNASRIELNTLATHLEEFGACEFIQIIAAEQKHIADGKHISMSIKCAEGLPHFFADKNLLRMVFQNLISNALKYTPVEGTVECELSLGGTAGESIFLRVSDTGIGIPVSEQGRVFDKLFRASNAQMTVPDGTGLGLYVVKMIIERVKGGITFDSTEGKGTTFYLTIPARWPMNNSGDKK